MDMGQGYQYRMDKRLLSNLEITEVVSMTWDTLGAPVRSPNATGDLWVLLTKRSTSVLATCFWSKFSLMEPFLKSKRRTSRTMKQDG